MADQARPVYLDHAATTPVDPRVAEVVMRYMTVEFGNAGSRTHVYGAEAAKAVKKAREDVATVVDASPTDVIFTSGATEAINLAILGLREHGDSTGKRHIVSTMIEHKAALEALNEMERRGFEISLVQPNEGGWIEPQAVLEAIRDDTLLVSVMHVNNETGVIQPLADIADGLRDSGIYLHADAAQGFGKELEQLRHQRIDMISISGHKIGAPKGIGGLILRRRRYKLPPLQPLIFGGGQERGLRGGTVPVHLVTGLGEAARLALKEHDDRKAAAARFRSRLWEALSPLRAVVNGDADRTVATTLNVSFRGTDSEAVMLALKPYVAISNGSACTSATYEPSHVLSAMGLSDDRVRSATRWSWWQPPESVDWPAVVDAIEGLR